LSAHDVLFAVDPRLETRVEREVLRALAERVLEAESVPTSELGIVVTDDEQVRKLNNRYAGENKATDVLSFSLREGEEFVSPDATERLGEVIISLETAERQATEAGHSLEDEMAHLLVHGVLHLLGYDHGAPEDARVMRAREDALLGTTH
jgi:probable rRNA maturation factor